MKDPRFRWSTLLRKWMDDTIGPYELIELKRHRLSSEVKQQQFLELTNPKLFLKKVQLRHSINTDDAWKKMNRSV